MRDSGPSFRTLLQTVAIEHSALQGGREVHALHIDAGTSTAQSLGYDAL